MRSLLARAGFNARFGPLVLIGAVLTLTAVYLAIGLAVEGAGASRLVLQIGAWVAWFFWLAVLFPRHRTRTVASAPDTAYRSALIRHTVPGFSALAAINFLPAAYGVFARPAGSVASPLLASSPRVVAAVPILAAGVAIVALAFNSIGAPAMAFADEYLTEPVAHRAVGIYAYMRHPMAVGAMGMTSATALALRDADLLLIAINWLVLLPYCPLEDRRLAATYGHSNDGYVRQVARFTPSLRRRTE